MAILKDSLCSHKHSSFIPLHLPVTLGSNDQSLFIKSASKVRFSGAILPHMWGTVSGIEIPTLVYLSFLYT